MDAKGCRSSLLASIFLIKPTVVGIWSRNISNTRKSKKTFPKFALEILCVCIYIYVYIYVYVYTYLMTMMHEHDSCPTLLNPLLGFLTKKPVVIFFGFHEPQKCHKANGNAPWCYFTRCRSGISRRGLKKPWRWWLMMTWITQKERPLRFGPSIVLNFRWQNSWSPQKNDSDFFLFFLEGVLLDELSYCSQQRFPSIKIINHRIPDQNINMSIFSCLLVIHLAWLDGIHSPDFMVRNLWLWPCEKNNPFLCLFSGALAAGFWECTWWFGSGIFHVQWHLYT